MHAIRDSRFMLHRLSLGALRLLNLLRDMQSHDSHMVTIGLLNYHKSHIQYINCTCLYFRRNERGRTVKQSDTLS